MELTRLGFIASLTSEQYSELTAALRDPDEGVRLSALGAIVRNGEGDDIQQNCRVAQIDEHPIVRRRACELAPQVRGLPLSPVIELAGDPDPSVAEAAAKTKPKAMPMLFASLIFMLRMYVAVGGWL